MYTSYGLCGTVVGGLSAKSGGWLVATWFHCTLHLSVLLKRRCLQQQVVYELLQVHICLQLREKRERKNALLHENMATWHTENCTTKQTANFLHMNLLAMGLKVWLQKQIVEDSC